MGNDSPQSANSDDRPDFERTYLKHVEELNKTAGSHDAAMQQAIGGEFEAIGTMELDLLIAAGLQPDGYVIDVGCGSGRLAAPLSRYLTGGYLGTDVVPELLSYASEKAARAEWRFEISLGLEIPAPDACADIVCFFSVFTHLLHEETYRYLQEAKRVLKPTGRIVFSFLEFAIPSHWAVFDATIASIGLDKHLNQFMSRDGIEAWCEHLGLQIEALDDGDKPSIPLRAPVVLEGGQIYEKLGALGQSIAILSLAD